MSEPPGTKALAFVGSRLLLRRSGEGLRLPTTDELEADLGRPRLEAGRVDVTISVTRTRVLTFGFPEDEPVPDGYRLDGLRVAFHSLEEADFRAAGAARQKVQWRLSTRYCSGCASPLEATPGQEALRCPSCGRLHFPPVSPAVIVLVEREGMALLGRSPRFDEGVYSTLAGFVEPGESLEECVHREIAEEVGVRVTNLRYFGSQPHPFPHSLMVGFVADWLEGDIRIDEEEIEDARWFPPDDLPVLPHPMSIARALIEDFVRRAS
ncbi:MAG: NAD(+) diphosphatase [Longimicrobiales bacterium]|nr:NAD(+) diphosphatase [Longimicrobiales bacterium]